MDGSLTASDVALLNNDGMGSWNGMIWLFAILALMGGGFGSWGGNGNTNALQADVNRGFDNQNLQAQTRDIMSAVNAGTAQSVAATNQTFHDNLAAMQNLYNETARDISGLALGQANILANQNECCCSTKMLIQQNNYDGAIRDAATNANFTAQIQSIKDMISQNKIESLQNQVNQLSLQNAMSGVIRYPTNTFYSVPSTIFTTPTTTTGA